MDMEESGKENIKTSEYSKSYKWMWTIEKVIEVNNMGRGDEGI